MTKRTQLTIPSERNFCMCDLYYALTDGLFEPTKKVKDADLHYRRVTRDFEAKFKDQMGKSHVQKITLGFRYPSTLNTQAESILLAVLKIAGENRLEIQPEQMALQIFVGVEEVGQARKKPIIQTTCTMLELLKAAGMNSDKRSYQQLKFYLEELAATTVKWRNHDTKWEGSSRMMEHAVNDDGSLIIQVNWRLAGAILGTYLYAEINLDERNTLKKDAAKTLHRWLSAHLRRQIGDRQEYIEYHTLIKHIWSEKASGSTQRKRLERLKNEILPQINGLVEWTVEMKPEGAIITRHQGDYRPNNPPQFEAPKVSKKGKGKTAK